MLFRKVSATILAGSIFVTSLVPITQASEIQQTAPATESGNIGTFNTSLQKGDAPQSIGGSFIVKQAIKIIINNKSKVISLVEGQMGKKTAAQLDKHYSKVVAELKPLLAWSEVPAQAVYDAVYRGMINAGVSNSVATNVALGVKTILNWLV